MSTGLIDAPPQVWANIGRSHPRPQVGCHKARPVPPGLRHALGPGASRPLQGWNSWQRQDGTVGRGLVAPGSANWWGWDLAQHSKVPPEEVYPAVQNDFSLDSGFGYRIEGSTVGSPANMQPRRVSLAHRVGDSGLSLARASSHITAFVAGGSGSGPFGALKLRSTSSRRRLLKECLAAPTRRALLVSHPPYGEGDGSPAVSRWVENHVKTDQAPGADEPPADRWTQAGLQHAGTLRECSNRVNLGALRYPPVRHGCTTDCMFKQALGFHPARLRQSGDTASWSGAYPGSRCPPPTGSNTCQVFKAQGLAVAWR